MRACNEEINDIIYEELVKRNVKMGDLYVYNGNYFVLVNIQLIELPSRVLLEYYEFDNKPNDDMVNYGDNLETKVITPQAFFKRATKEGYINLEGKNKQSKYIADATINCVKIKKEIRVGTILQYILKDRYYIVLTMNPLTMYPTDSKLGTDYIKELESNMKDICYKLEHYDTLDNLGYTTKIVDTIEENKVNKLMLKLKLLGKIE